MSRDLAKSAAIRRLGEWAAAADAVEAAAYHAATEWAAAVAAGEWTAAAEWMAETYEAEAAYNAACKRERAAAAYLAADEGAP